MSDVEFRKTLKNAIRNVSAIAVFSSVILAGVLAFGQGNGVAIVAKVNGIEIRENALATAEEELGNTSGADPKTRRQILIGYLTDRILINQAADEMAIQNTPEFKRRLDAASYKIKMQLLFSQISDLATNDAAVRKAYDEAIKKSAGAQEVRAREILVQDETQAKSIVADAKSGKDFAELAKLNSGDRLAGQGGDLGYVTHDQLPPELSNVAFSLKVGDISNPIKGAAGWYIIKIDDKRERPAPSFEDSKEELKDYLAHKAQLDFVSSLRGRAKVEFPQNSPASK